MNPLNDDLGGGLFRGQNPKKKREDKEPTISYHELDEAHQRIRALYGPQEHPEQKQKYREGRPIR